MGTQRTWTGAVVWTLALAAAGCSQPSYDWSWDLGLDIYEVDDVTVTGTLGSTAFGWDPWAEAWILAGTAGESLWIQTGTGPFLEITLGTGAILGTRELRDGVSWDFDCTQACPVGLRLDPGWSGLDVVPILHAMVSAEAAVAGVSHVVIDLVPEVGDHLLVELDVPVDDWGRLVPAPDDLTSSAASDAP